MKALLNTRQCEIPGDLTTFQDLVLFVEQERLPRGHVLTRIVLDGNEISEEEEQELQETPLRELAIVEFQSSRIVDLAREQLTEAVEVLPELGQKLKKTVRDLRSGDFISGMESLYDSIGTIDWYVNLVTALDVMFSSGDPAFRLDPGMPPAGEMLDPGHDLAALSGSGGSEMATFVSVENLRDKLLEMEEAQEKKDLQLLADVLEYEVAPIVAIWAREAPILLAKVRREGASA